MLNVKITPNKEDTKTEFHIEGEGSHLLLEYERLTAKLFEIFSNEVSGKVAANLLLFAFSNGIGRDVLLEVLGDKE